MAIIAHVDMDAFFAAVEERNNLQWAGKPIVVGSDPQSGQGRGVVSTANYAARKFGIGSATPIRTAWKLAQAAQACGEPETIFLPGHWHTYSETSKKIMSLIAEFSPRIQQQEHLTASVGIGPNKLTAKIAANFHKPNGLMSVPPKQVEAFLEPMPVRAIPGIGPKTEQFLKYEESAARALRLLLPFLDHRKNPRNKLIRLIGLRIEKLL